MNGHEMLELLKSPDAADRRFAAGELGYAAHTAAVPALLAALADESVPVREAAADALMSIGGEAVCRPVMELLHSDDAPLRNYAVEILESLPADDVQPLAVLAVSPSADVRKFVVDVLGRVSGIENTPAYDCLLGALADVNVNVAAAAAEAVAQIAQPAAIDALAGQLGRHGWLDATLLLAIAQIGGPEAREALSSVSPAALGPEAGHAYALAVSTVGLSGEERS
jgi:HEAT repeat protein